MSTILFYETLKNSIKTLEKNSNNDLDLLTKSKDLIWDTIQFPFEKLLVPKEEKLLDYIYSSDYLWITDDSSKIIKEVLTLEEQREFFSKMFVQDFIMKTNHYDPRMKYRYDVAANTCDETIGTIFSKYASQRLKKDSQFAKTVLSLNGQYLNCFDETISTNEEFIALAIKNDKSKRIESFLSCSEEEQKEEQYGLLFLKKIAQTQTPEEIYLNILKRNSKKEYPKNEWTENLKETPQRTWLLSANFIKKLSEIEPQFLEMIVRGLISKEKKQLTKNERVYLSTLQTFSEEDKKVLRANDIITVADLKKASVQDLIGIDQITGESIRWAQGFYDLEPGYQKRIIKNSNKK